MAYSKKLSDIIVLEKCEVYSTKSNFSFCFSLSLSQKGHNSVKCLQMISKFELDLYCMMLYHSVKVKEIVASRQKLLIGNHNLA